MSWAVVLARTTTGALPPWWAAVPLVLGWFGVLLAVCDVFAHRLPDALTLPAYPAVLVALLPVLRGDRTAGVLTSALLGLVVFASCYACVRLIAAAALGPGDVKLAGVLGAALGAVSLAAVLLTVIAAAVLTLLAALVTRRAVLAHGPAMLLPAWLLAAFPELSCTHFPGC